jgi:hypothetical protein
VTATTVDVEGVLTGLDFDPLCECHIDGEDSPQCGNRAVWWVTTVCPPCDNKESGYMCAWHAWAAKTALARGGFTHACGRAFRPGEVTWRGL